MFNAPRFLWRASAVFGLAAASFASAQSLTFAPTRLFMEGNQRSTSVAITNGTQQTTSYSVEVVSWKQDGTDVYAETRDLVVNPVRFTLRAGQQQTIRLAFRGTPPNGERTYRLFISELPAAQTDAPAPQTGASFGIQTLFRISLPVFVLPTAGQPNLNFSLERTAEGTSLVVRNTGNRFARLVNFAVVQGDNSVADGTTFNVLAGGTMRLQLTGPDAAVIPEVTLRYFLGEATSQEQRVTVRSAP